MLDISTSGLNETSSLMVAPFFLVLMRCYNIWAQPQLSLESVDK